ncbi:hypothetical protein BH24GEM1_BH24GEM1_08990 [soil metagenome]
MLAGCAVMSSAACGDDGTGPNIGPRTETFSFEDGLGAWLADATDITVGGDPIAWDVAVTDEAATDGERSVRLSLDNLSDAGKIWIERSFDLEPETSYSVRIEFDFGTADFGDVNLWTIIAGASPQPPETAQDLQDGFRDETGHDQGQDAGLVWLEKAYDFVTTTEADGVLHVALGVWGTYEVSRIYFVDAVRITFTRALTSN